MFSVFFFFTDTATPEIYTYRHTLSLPDARPISETPSAPASRRTCHDHDRSRHHHRGARRCRGFRGPGRTAHRRRVGPGAHRRRQRTARCRGSRSEEHTSELQSLMRISYAGFCLKKKTEESKENEEHTHIA